MKKNLFGLLAIAIAVVSLAFTTTPAKKTAGTYFKFTGNITSSSEVADESKWIEATLEECEAGLRACFIEADENGSTGHPQVVYVHSLDNLQPIAQPSAPTGQKVYNVFNRVP
jgi:hypothetical protein